MWWPFKKSPHASTVLQKDPLEGVGSVAFIILLLMNILNETQSDYIL